MQKMLLPSRANDPSFAIAGACTVSHKPVLSSRGEVESTLNAASRS
jgi:hypothetical protein